MKPVVGVIGMTHLGLVSAAAIAGRGFRTVGFDPDAALVDRLQKADWPILEPGLNELIRTGDLSFTASTSDVGACGVIYIAGDVPTDDAGTSDVASIHALIDSVSKAMGASAVLVVLSQVPPGFTRALTVRPPDQLYYQVETLVFGRAIERATKPERFIVGCSDSARPIAPALAAVLEAFGCPILPMRYESAELAKISINCCLVGSISVANMLAELCERIGADWSEIAPALRLDARIGSHAYLTPGLGIAGGNLERDLASVVRMADAAGTDARLVNAWQNNSVHRRDWVLRQLRDFVFPKIDAPVIGILGVTYKENTHSTKNSPSVALIKDIRHCKVQVFDPAVRASSEWHPSLTATNSALETCDGADALVVMTPWPEFRAVQPGEVARRLRNPIVIDPFAMFDRTASAAAGLTRIALGAAPLVTA